MPDIAGKLFPNLTTLIVQLLSTGVLLLIFKKFLWKNVMESSMLTIITLLALSIGSLLGGTTIVETIFMWDGVGKMAVDAITMRDYPIIQAYVAWMAIIYVVVNLITDIIYHYLDPRVRLGGDQA